MQKFLWSLWPAYQVTYTSDEPCATPVQAEVDGVNTEKQVRVGYCPQFDAIWPEFTCGEALILLARIHDYVSPKKTTDSLLEMIDMTEHANKRLGQCSGGQKRRLSVAAALISTITSHILVLDEATVGIDPRARRDIWRLLIAVKQHMTILMSSHGMDECEALCNRIAIMKKGGLATIGTSQGLISTFGNFYVLTMVLPSKERQKEVADAVSSRFPGAVHKADGFSLHLKWQLPKSGKDSWSSLFTACIQLSQEIFVPDFCLTQSSLEDVFSLED